MDHDALKCIACSVHHPPPPLQPVLPVGLPYVALLDTAGVCVAAVCPTSTSLVRAEGDHVRARAVAADLRPGAGAIHVPDPVPGARWCAGPDRGPGVGGQGPGAAVGRLVLRARPRAGHRVAGRRAYQVRVRQQGGAVGQPHPVTATPII